MKNKLMSQPINNSFSMSVPAYGGDFFTLSQTDKTGFRVDKCNIQVVIYNFGWINHMLEWINLTIHKKNTDSTRCFFTLTILD
jgi:hypothetical protein